MRIGQFLASESIIDLPAGFLTPTRPCATSALVNMFRMGLYGFFNIKDKLGFYSISSTYQISTRAVWYIILVAVSGYVKWPLEKQNPILYIFKLPGMQLLWVIALLLSLVLPSQSYPRLSAAAGGFGGLKTALSSSMILQRANRFMQSMLPTAVQEMALVGDLKKVIEEGPIPAGERCFIINGWRWHTAAVIRDLERFKLLVHTEMKQEGEAGALVIDASTPTAAEADSSKRKRAAERIWGSYSFVFDFSWKALVKIESEIFFPWLQKLLPPSAVNLMTDIVQQHSVINALSGKVQQQCSSLVNADLDAQAQIASFKRIEDLVGQLQACALRIQSVQESIFVPYISAFVSRKEQESFNRQVISRLGLVDSQVHLVSMLDAIRGQPKEIKMYEAQIPRLLRAVLPVWRKRLYLPRGARFLE